MTKHGTTNAYAKGCRCAHCRDAKSSANARQRVLAEAVDPVELTGGVWVPRDGIMRWEAGPPVSLCGTDSGYYRHLRTLREPACRDCKDAHRDYERQRSNAQPPVDNDLLIVGGSRHDDGKDTTNKSALAEVGLRPGPRRPVKDTTDSWAS